VNPSAGREFDILDPIWITLPDGCRLAARVWLPRGAREKPVPAILEYLPYRRRDGTFIRDHAMHAWYAMNGYAGVRVDIRGTGDSEGLLDDEYTRQEQLDGVAVIGWLARQPWCSGAVGMIGISWGGFNALQIAALRPPALKAIVTVCSTDDRFADDCHFMGGAALTNNFAWAATLGAMQTRPPDPMVVGARWRGMWRTRLETMPLFAANWFTHQTYDAYWRHGSVAENYGAIACPVFAVGGWADGYSNAVPRLVAGLKTIAKGLIGPWAHRYPHEGAPGPAIGFLEETKSWWDRFLRDEPNGVENWPALRVWIDADRATVRLDAPRRGEWVAIDNWPNAPERLTWHLGPYGLLEQAARAGDELVLRTPQDHGAAGGSWCPYGYDGDMPGDQQVDDEHSVVLETAPLREAIDLLGHPELELRFICDVPIANLVARLVDLAPDGAASRVSYGVLNLCHRGGSETPSRLLTETPTRATLRLNACGARIAAGHRIRLALATTYWPIVWPSPLAATVKLDLPACRLSLPLLPTSATPLLTNFAPPSSAGPAPSRVIRPSDRRAMVHGDGDIGMSIVIEKDRGAVEIVEHGMAIDFKGRETYAIRPDNPLTAFFEADWRYAASRPNWRVGTRFRMQVSGSMETLDIYAQLQASTGEDKVSEREWRISLPRRFV
jgi:putative CocE/NonD family hydrolase